MTHLPSWRLHFRKTTLLVVLLTSGLGCSDFSYNARIRPYVAQYAETINWFSSLFTETGLIQQENLVASIEDYMRRLSESEEMLSTVRMGINSVNPGWSSDNKDFSSTFLEAADGLLQWVHRLQAHAKPLKAAMQKYEEWAEAEQNQRRATFAAVPSLGGGLTPAMGEAIYYKQVTDRVSAEYQNAMTALRVETERDMKMGHWNFDKVYKSHNRFRILAKHRLGIAIMELPQLQ